MSNNLSLGLTPNITIAGYTFTNVGNLIVLQGYVSTNTYSACRTGVLTTSYQVTAGKTFYVLGVRFGVTAGSPQMIVGYGDTDVGVNSAAAPTNYKSPLAEVVATGSAIVEIAYAATLQIPATKYPTFKCSAGGWSLVYGYEA